jgi:predicted nucleic acid-binding protein
VKAIADTGFFVALARASDQYHTWAREVAGELTEPPITCEAVLAEAAFHLRSAAYVLSLLSNDVVCPKFDLRAEWKRVGELAIQYADRRPDLADLCLIRMSEINPACPVITTDRDDFTIYRRYGHERIPLIFPPV